MSNKKFSLLIIFFTILFVPIGTITHELGHFLVAKSINVDARITYKSTILIQYEDLHLKVKEEINNALLPCSNNSFLSKSHFDWYEIPSLLSVKTKEKYIQYLNDLKKITLGGPIITILLGTIGFIFLLLHKEKINSQSQLSIFIIVFTSLFWLRELLHLFLSLFINNINTNYSDEVVIARLFHLPILSIISIFGLIAFVIFIKVILSFEKKLQGHFIISLGIGSLIGYTVWFSLIGPLLMP